MAAVVAGTIAWIGVIAIGLQLAGRSPSSLGFDLELLIEAGREVAAGRSPYADELVAGRAPMATSLFYSYPPPVAQVFSLLTAVPSRVILVLWSVGAVIGLLVVTEFLRRSRSPHRSRGEVLLVVAACAPLTLPFAVGLLFGNLDVWFPFLYGAMLLAAVAPGRATAVGGGVALALAAVKLHPASLGFWFLVRAFRDRRPEGRAAAGVVVVSAVVTGALIVVASVLIAAPGLWPEYLDVVRAGAGATIVDPRNAGIGAQVAALIGAGDAFARSIHVLVAVAAVLVTVWAAWGRPDPVESFAWATAASLATLPVTWYHYPSALIPIAVAAMLRATGPERRRVTILVAAGAVVAAVAIAWLPLLWVAIGLIVAAARASAPAQAPDSAAAPAPATG
jgi:Glycosyltransferase family 87